MISGLRPQHSVDAVWDLIEMIDSEFFWNNRLLLLILWLRILKKAELAFFGDSENT